MCHRIACIQQPVLRQDYEVGLKAPGPRSALANFKPPSGGFPASDNLADVLPTLSAPRSYDICCGQQDAQLLASDPHFGCQAAFA